MACLQRIQLHQCRHCRLYDLAFLLRGKEQGSEEKHTFSSSYYRARSGTQAKCHIKSHIN
jgi:hypothetical protein